MGWVASLGPGALAHAHDFTCAHHACFFLLPDFNSCGCCCSSETLLAHVSRTQLASGKSARPFLTAPAFVVAAVALAQAETSSGAEQVLGLKKKAPTWGKRL